MDAHQRGEANGLPRRRTKRWRRLQQSNRNVIAYTSAFLQKPQVPGLSTTINREDINGFMAGVHGLDPQKSLLLLLHTPGGFPSAGPQPQ